MRDLSKNVKHKTRRYFRPDAKKYFKLHTRPPSNGFFRHPKIIDDLPLDGNSHSLYVRMISSAGYMTNNYGEIYGTLDYWAKRQGVTRKVIRTCLNKLIELGLIHQVGETRNAKRYIVNYSLFREGEFNQEKVNEAFKSLGRIKSEKGPNNYHGKPASIDTLNDSISEKGPNNFTSWAQKNAESGLNTNPKTNELMGLNNNNIYSVTDETLEETKHETELVANDENVYYEFPDDWVSVKNSVNIQDAVIYQHGNIVRRPYQFKPVSESTRSKQINELRRNYKVVVTSMLDKICDYYDSNFNEEKIFYGFLNRVKSVNVTDYKSYWFDYCFMAVRRYVVEGNRLRDPNYTPPDWFILEQMLKVDALEAFNMSGQLYDPNQPCPESLSQVCKMRNVFNMYCLLIRNFFGRLRLTEKMLDVFRDNVTNPDWKRDVKSTFISLLPTDKEFLKRIMAESIRDSDVEADPAQLILSRFFRSVDVEPDEFGRVKSVTINGVRVSRNDYWDDEVCNG